MNFCKAQSPVKFLSCTMFRKYLIKIQEVNMDVKCVALNLRFFQFFNTFVKSPWKDQAGIRGSFGPWVFGVEQNSEETFLMTFCFLPWMVMRFNL